jgi:hypothetical protein
MIKDAVAALPDDTRALVKEYGISVVWSTDPIQVLAYPGVPFMYVDRALLTEPDQTGYSVERIDHTEVPDHVPEDWTD